MTLFVTSKASATRHGVFGLEKQPSTIIAAAGFGVAAIVEQFPWGPSQTLTEPSTPGELLVTLAPPGMTRTGAGYLTIIRKSFPLLKYVRVLGSTAAVASSIIPRTVPTGGGNLVRVDLKYAGTEGNAVVVTASAASDGDANHFNITATVTGASGTTTDIIQNWNVSGVGADTTLGEADKAKLRLIGDVVKVATGPATGLPTLGSVTATGGTNGTIAAADYVGTAGTNDRGIAKLEGDLTIDHFFTADPGNTDRAAVNAGIKAHADLMTDRVGYINGNSGLTVAATQTDVANYRSQRVVYVDSWCYVYDDVTGTKRLVPPAAFAASVASQLSPSTSIAWKGSPTGAMLGGIVELEADRGNSAATNTAQGICTLIRKPNGGFAFEAGVLTIAPSSPAKKNHTRTRMGHYMARSIKNSIGESVDAPNVPVIQQDIVDATVDFIENLVLNAAKDPINLPHLVDGAVGDVQAENTDVDLAAGDFTLPIDAQTSSGMERIFLSFNFGETVTVSSD
jgi:phage tail sheath protein FI